MASSQSVLRARATLSGLQAAVRFHRFRLAHKFNEDQPRDERGRWTESDADSDESATFESLSDASVESIASRAKELNVAARSDAYNECLDLCYPLLERVQPPGSDRNT